MSGPGEPPILTDNLCIPSLVARNRFLNLNARIVRRESYLPTVYRKCVYSGVKLLFRNIRISVLVAARAAGLGRRSGTRNGGEWTGRRVVTFNRRHFVPAAALFARARARRQFQVTNCPQGQRDAAAERIGESAGRCSWREHAGDVSRSVSSLLVRRLSYDRWVTRLNWKHRTTQEQLGLKLEVTSVRGCSGRWPKRCTSARRIGSGRCR